MARPPSANRASRFPWPADTACQLPRPTTLCPPSSADNAWPDAGPALWDDQSDTHDWTPARFADHTIAVAEEFRRGFEAVIADLVASAPPVIMEGDHLLPDLRTGFGEAVRTVVVSEPDEDRIVMNYRSQGSRRRRATASSDGGAVLDAQLSIRAARLDVPVVAAWPWTDSLDRRSRAPAVRNPRRP
jgi:hypothetical protein